MITLPTNGELIQIYPRLKPLDSDVEGPNVKYADMGSDFITEIIDVENGMAGGVQAVWSGNNAFDGELDLVVSNLKEASSFSTYDESIYTITSGHTAHFWNVGGAKGYRYFKIRYEHGTITAGQIRIVATCKR